MDLIPLVLAGLLLASGPGRPGAAGGIPVQEWEGRSLATALAPQGTTYYVATTGRDSNPGTIAQPWRTIQKAANTVVARRIEREGDDG